MKATFPFQSDALLEKGLAALGFSQDDRLFPFGAHSGAPSGECSVFVRGVGSIIPLVARYIKELELFNAVFDLVGVESGSVQGRGDLVVRHILDSLAPWKELAAVFAEQTADLEEGGRHLEVADAGSGAGFPGIPLSIIFPEISFTLIERMSRRCSFLENCVAMLGLKNVSVLNSGIEKATAHAFDMVVFRAFRPLDTAMIRILLALTKKTGILAAYKGKKEKIDEEMEAISCEVNGWKIIPLTVPFLEYEERHLVFIT